MTATIRGISADNFEALRDKCRPFLENFASRSWGRWTVDSLESAIRDRRMQVFCINNFQALCLTAVSPEAVSIEACAGRDRIEWQDDLDDAIKGWARQEGKARVISMMRPGWVRHAKTRGYREGHREMVCEL